MNSGRPTGVETAGGYGAAKLRNNRQSATVLPDWSELTGSVSRSRAAMARDRHRYEVYELSESVSDSELMKGWRFGARSAAECGKLPVPL